MRFHNDPLPGTVLSKETEAIDGRTVLTVLTVTPPPLASSFLLASPPPSSPLTHQEKKNIETPPPPKKERTIKWRKGALKKEKDEAVMRIQEESDKHVQKKEKKLFTASALCMHSPKELDESLFFSSRHWIGFEGKHWGTIARQQQSLIERCFREDLMEGSQRIQRSGMLPGFWVRVEPQVLQYTFETRLKALMVKCSCTHHSALSWKRIDTTLHHSFRFDYMWSLYFQIPKVIPMTPPRSLPPMTTVASTETLSSLTVGRRIWNGRKQRRRSYTALPQATSRETEKAKSTLPTTSPPLRVGQTVSLSSTSASRSVLNIPSSSLHPRSSFLSYRSSREIGRGIDSYPFLVRRPRLPPLLAPSFSSFFSCSRDSSIGKRSKAFVSLPCTSPFRPRDRLLPQYSHTHRIGFREKWGGSWRDIIRDHWREIVEAFTGDVLESMGSTVVEVDLVGYELHLSPSSSMHTNSSLPITTVPREKNPADNNGRKPKPPPSTSVLALLVKCTYPIHVTTRELVDQLGRNRYPRVWGLYRQHCVSKNECSEKWGLLSFMLPPCLTTHLHHHYLRKRENML